MNELPLPERRAMVSQLEAQVAAAVPVPENVETEDATIPGAEGAPDIAIRIYRPTEVAGDRPGLYYIHGGGMVVGSLETSSGQVGLADRELVKSARRELLTACRLSTVAAYVAE